MSNSINKINYDELTQIAKQLHSESEDYTRLNSQTRQRMDALRGGWQGDAAAAFFNEMNGELIPATQRLSSALLTGETVLYQIMRIIHEADEETASYFKNFAADGNPGRKTRIYIINGIDYVPGADNSDKGLNTLKDKIKAQYGPNVDVVIVGYNDEKYHPYNTNLQQYARFFSTDFGGFLKPVDQFTNWASTGILTLTNKAVGLGQVINEYISGGSTESQKVMQWIQDDMTRNGLIGDSNLDVVLLPHSGGGAIAANIAGTIEDRLQVNVSGIATLGSPFSNYDLASKNVEKILDIRHQADNFGSPLGLGTFRSDEMRFGIPVAAGSGLIPALASFFVDSTFRDPTVNVQNITLTDQNISWWDAPGGHDSYWYSDQLVDSLAPLINGTP